MKIGRRHLPSNFFLLLVISVPFSTLSASEAYDQRDPPIALQQDPASSEPPDMAPLNETMPYFTEVGEDTFGTTAKPGTVKPGILSMIKLVNFTKSSSCSDDYLVADLDTFTFVYLVANPNTSFTLIPGQAPVFMWNQINEEDGSMNSLTCEPNFMNCDMSSSDLCSCEEYLPGKKYVAVLHFTASLTLNNTSVMLAWLPSGKGTGNVYSLQHTLAVGPIKAACFEEYVGAGAFKGSAHQVKPSVWNAVATLMIALVCKSTGSWLQTTA